MEDLEGALALEPEHLSCYELTFEEGTALTKDRARGRVEGQDQDSCAAMYHATIARLESRGFAPYEVSAFAKPNEECRHNLVYWTGGDWIGVGAGAGSSIGNTKFLNIKNPSAYAAAARAGDAADPATREEADARTRLAEVLMMGLRLTGGSRSTSFARAAVSTRSRRTPRRSTRCAATAFSQSTADGSWRPSAGATSATSSPRASSPIVRIRAMPEPFADRLAAAIQQKGSPCCVGLDPRLDWLPSELTARARLRPTPVAVADVVIEFHRRILARIAPIVPAIKPQLAFFEQLGSAGIAAYEDLVVRAHELGLLVIADAKRGDIGPTADAYARVLGWCCVPRRGPLAPAADALTIQPYFGTDGVEPFLEACARTGGGLFVLVRTSNPSSSELQSLRCGEHTLAEEAARLVDRWGSSFVGKSGWSSVGAVVGATHKKELAGLRAAMPRTPFLLPGYGAQGARPTTSSTSSTRAAAAASSSPPAR